MRFHPGARLLPLTRVPRVSLPSQVKGMSRLRALTVVVAAGAKFFTQSTSFEGDAVNFLETRQASFDLFQSGPAQVPDAVFVGVFADVNGTAAGENDPRDGF